MDRRFANSPDLLFAKKFKSRRIRFANRRLRRSAPMRSPVLSNIAELAKVPSAPIAKNDVSCNPMACICSWRSACRARCSGEGAAPFGTASATPPPPPPTAVAASVEEEEEEEAEATTASMTSELDDDESMSTICPIAFGNCIVADVAIVRNPSATNSDFASGYRRDSILDTDGWGGGDGGGGFPSRMPPPMPPPMPASPRVAEEADVAPKNECVGSSVS